MPSTIIQNQKTVCTRTEADIRNMRPIGRIMNSLPPRQSKIGNLIMVVTRLGKNAAKYVILLAAMFLVCLGKAALPDLFSQHTSRFHRKLVCRHMGRQIP